MIKRVVFAFDEASQTLIDSLDAEIVELVDGRRLILPKLHGATECALTQRARDGACESCKLELTPSCPIRTGNGCDLYQPRQ